MYWKTWSRDLLLYLFVQVFRGWEYTVCCFDFYIVIVLAKNVIVLANNDMAEQLDRSISFGSISKNIRYLWKIL